MTPRDHGGHPVPCYLAGRGPPACPTARQHPPRTYSGHSSNLEYEMLCMMEFSIELEEYVHFTFLFLGDLAFDFDHGF